MSQLQETLNETLAALPADGMGKLATPIDRAWIEQALRATGKASIRGRKLPADLRGLDHSLTLFDRAYFSAAFLLDWHSAGAQRHGLMRTRDNLRHEIVQTLCEGDC